MTPAPADISPERIATMASQFINDSTQGMDPQDVADVLLELRQQLTASEKQRDEAVRLLRAVGAGGIFTLMAESSDDADVWYDQRDAILAKGETK